MVNHQYIERHTQQVRDEALHGDAVVRALYSAAPERAQWLTAIASSQWVSDSLAFISYDRLLGSRVTGMKGFLQRAALDLAECVEPPANLDTAQKIFERQIRFWECRPLPDDSTTAVCPADSRVLVGSLADSSLLFIKEKFFNCAELLSADRSRWLNAFAGGDFAVFRLTPEKYHYVHVPAAGLVQDFYEVRGRYHSCNPGALVSLVAPHAKNRRVITIMQTDVAGGTGIGLVAIIEVVALMVGQIVERYSEEKYDAPRRLEPGMFLRRGQPKSLFRPGSSTVILLFQPERVRFADDLIRNRFRRDATSRFSLGFDQSIVETDVAVRSLLAFRQPNERNSV